MGTWTWRPHRQRKPQHPPINNQAVQTELPLQIIGMDPTLNELIQEILHSDSFKVWVIEKAIQETVVFYYEEHAVYAYVYELSCGPLFHALPSQPNDLGMFSIHVRLLLSGRSLLVSTCHHFSAINLSE